MDEKHEARIDSKIECGKRQQILRLSKARSHQSDADSTAEDRLQWRNQPPIFTPDLEKGDPFNHSIGHDLDKAEAVDSFGSTISRIATADLRQKDNNVAGDKGFSKEMSRHEGRKEEEDGENLGFRERVRHFTWTWFTMTMATGGIANVLYTVPFRFHGLYALGCIFFMLNIVLFIFNITMISLRFFYWPKTFKASFVHPTESLFIPASVISFGTILINISQYGVTPPRYWLGRVMLVLYWVDCGLAVCFSIGIYLIMWSTQYYSISQMTPIWIFPAYPLLIVGPHAANLSPKILDKTKALDVIISGFVIQGIGFLVSLMIYSAFIYRLMTQKLPKESLRPGMFVSVGPSGFTIAAIVGMGQRLPKIVPKDFMGPGMGELTGKVSQICANWVGLWLWGLALWFFFVSCGAHVSTARKGKMDYAMTWYSFVFPNTALTTATFAVAKSLGGNRPIQYVGCAMTIGLILTWFFVFGAMVRAVRNKQILWPQKQEDRTEGGWTEPDGADLRRVHGSRTDGEGGRWRKLSFSGKSVMSMGRRRLNL